MHAHFTAFSNTCVSFRSAAVVVCQLIYKADVAEVVALVVVPPSTAAVTMSCHPYERPFGPNLEFGCLARRRTTSCLLSVSPYFKLIHSHRWQRSPPIPIRRKRRERKLGIEIFHTPIALQLSCGTMLTTRSPLPTHHMIKRKGG